MVLLLLYHLVILCVFPPQVYADDALRINEVLVHPSSGNKEWVEFFNPVRVSLQGFWIDDDDNFTEDSGTSSKKNMSQIQEGIDPVYPYIEVTSLFNNSGDKVVLFDESGRIVDRYEYTDDPGSDISFGRLDTGEFAVLSSRTKGEANSLALPTDTPTPPPTATPTKSPTATKIPTPTKVPTATKKPPTIVIKSPTVSNQSVTASVTNSRATKKLLLKISPTRKASMSGYPTSILGASTMIEKKPTPVKKKSVNNQENNSFQIILISAGGIFLCACGILIYYRRKRNLG